MVLVQTGILKSRVPIGNLRLLDKSKISIEGKPAGKRAGGGVRTAGISRGSRSVSGRGGLAEVDLRGMNIEEALIEVDRFIDSSVLSGVHQINDHPRQRNRRAA